MLVKSEEIINNGQSRDTGNVEYTSHRTKTTKAKTTHNIESYVP
jgi:hypothetical protein